VTTPAPAPVGWLQLDDVKDQLKIRLTDTVDDQLIGECIDATEPEITRCRPDSWDDTRTPAGTPDAYRGAVMLAAKLVRRRNSPAGVESFTDSVASAAGDPELDRFLRTGRSRMPGVG
jgi:hypothetical protein